MRLTIIGCGDAFGSGGRANTCFWVETADTVLALDFGATALVELKKRELPLARLDLVVLSHLHGDHFGGLPFLLLDLQFNTPRDRPLTIIGPPGTTKRLAEAQEVFFPGSSTLPWRFPLDVVDLPCRHSRRFRDLAIESREVIHPSGAPATGVRIAADDRLLVYSGDTEWTEALPALARGADLFIVDCLGVKAGPAPHLDFPTVVSKLPTFEARRVMLTHLGDAMLAAASEARADGLLVAEDGLVLDV